MRRDHQKKGRTKPIEVVYDATLRLWRINVLDPDPSVYPFLYCDPEAGTREIKKTKRGGVHMT